MSHSDHSAQRCFKSNTPDGNKRATYNNKGQMTQTYQWETELKTT